MLDDWTGRRCGMVGGEPVDAAREGEMKEHTSNTDSRVKAPRPKRLWGGGFLHALEKRDIVIDLSGVTELDVTSLSMILTARQKAEEEGRIVWLAGLQLHLWQALSAMGLARLFKAFPIPDEAAV
jgi:hypothetical protein